MVKKGEKIKEGDESERPQVAKEYSNVDEFNDDVRKIIEGEGTDMYQRYEYKKLAEDEKKFAEMIGVPDVALFNSGMAAIDTAIESEELSPGDIILCSSDIYGVTKDYIDKLKIRGIKVQYFDPSDVDQLQKLVDTTHPRLIIAETISNTKEMKVADLGSYMDIVQRTNEEYTKEFTREKILDKYCSIKKTLSGISDESKQKILEAMEKFQENNKPIVFRSIVKEIASELGISTKEAMYAIHDAVKHTFTRSRSNLTLILDNTLPSPVLINPTQQTEGDKSELTVVESGTKHFQDGKNKITMGIMYSENSDKIERAKKLRIQAGSYLQSTSEEEIPDDITELMPTNLKQHASNALLLAKKLEEKGFTVSHPNLKSHKQGEVINELAPEGAVTLFYIELPENIKDRDVFMEKVKQIGGDGIGIGSSFGHKNTWLSSFDVDNRTIRIAVGMESSEEFTNVINAFEEAYKQ